jgi:hypothetical protein
MQRVVFSVSTDQKDDRYRCQGDLSRFSSAIAIGKRLKKRLVLVRYRGREVATRDKTAFPYEKIYFAIETRR